MKLRLLFSLVLLLALGVALPNKAEARGHVGIYASFGCCGGYYPYGAPYYSPYYYPSYYVAPPPVVYAVPPAAPIVYTPPPPVAIAPSAPVISANQTSPTFIDDAGRTCRHYQSTGGGAAFGTACLQPDGSWRAAQ